MNEKKFNPADYPTRLEDFSPEQLAAFRRLLSSERLAYFKSNYPIEKALVASRLRIEKSDYISIPFFTLFGDDNFPGVFPVFKDIIHPDPEYSDENCLVQRCANMIWRSICRSVPMFSDVDVWVDKTIPRIDEQTPSDCRYITRFYFRKTQLSASFLKALTEVDDYHKCYNAQIFLACSRGHAWFSGKKRIYSREIIDTEHEDNQYPTAGLIAIKEPDGRYRASYVRYDMYPEYALNVLHTHYRTRERINALLELSELVRLGRSFEYCIACHRDRGMEYNAPEVWETDKNFWFDVHYYRNAKYLYLFDNNHWSCSQLRG